MQRSHKINNQRIAGLLLCALCLFNSILKAQNTDVNILKKISRGRNESYQQFQSGLSFSVYPALVISPSLFLVKGIVKNDTISLKTGLSIGAGIALNSAITIGIKYSTDRNRPYVDHPEINNLETESTPSFPSGHTSSAFNLATSFTLLYPKWYVALPSYLWASGVAYSRMYLGVHYPSDVLAGAIIGSGTAWLNYYLNKKYVRLYKFKRLYR